MMSWLHNSVWVQQDYFWFLAGIGWLSVGVLWWQQRRTAVMPSWIPWSAGAGLAIAVAQLSILVTPSVRLAPDEVPSLSGDMVLGLIMAGLATGWWWSGLRRVKGSRVLGGVITVIALLVAAVRLDHPTEGTLAIVVLAAGAALWWCCGYSSSASPWRGALVAHGIATLLDTTGPLAAATTGGQRWYDFAPLGPWSALAQLAAAGVCIGYWWQANRRTEKPLEDRRLEHWYLRGIALWLLAGLAFAVVVGSWGRAHFENSALGRARGTAALLPLENVRALLTDEFEVGEVRWYEFADGYRLPTSLSAHAATHGGPVTHQILKIAAANPDMQSVMVTTLRNDWLVAAAIGEPNRKNFGSITLLRPVTREDRAAWDNRAAAFVGPTMLSHGEYVFARAPLIDGDDRMLGWLTYNFNVSQWIAAQAQPRTLAYLVIALGLIMGRQLVSQRIRKRERDVAQASAVTATQANQLKTTFLANVSHELRTPLQSILGYTELLMANVSSRDRERLLAVRENADLMGRLVNDLIDLSAAESGRFHLIERPVALSEIVVQAAESLRPQAEGKGLSLSVEASTEVPLWLHADPQRVRQVVLNLVGNAIKYTDLGHVAVHLGLAGRDQASAVLELRVEDTGPGIAAEDRAFLFEAFHRLEGTQAREGTGLGLAIAAAVSKAMGGSVSVQSDGRSGSTFTARWRLRLAPNIGPRSSSQVPLHGRRVLVADDNALVRDLFVAYLTECGAVCATASDGAETLSRLRREDFDAVVIDLAMPKLDGLATVRRIREEMPDRQWRIVGVSAHAGRTEHDEALAAGMDAFLIKPVTLPDLARALAPSIVWKPPVRSFEPMRAHFAHRFRAEAPAQTAAVVRALDSGEWAEIHAAAHYLKNSADVVGDSELARACAALEAAARARDRKAGDEAWRHCRLVLNRWLSEPHAN